MIPLVIALHWQLYMYIRTLEQVNAVKWYSNDNFYNFVVHIHLQSIDRFGILTFGMGELQSIVFDD